MKSDFVINRRLFSRNGPGLCCDEWGVSLGPVPIIVSSKAANGRRRYSARPAEEIAEVLRAAYGVVSVRSAYAFERVAKALNEGDYVLAAIAAVQIGLPEIAPECMTKLAASPLDKASSNDPKHPGWPAGTFGGRGGKFRPKDDSEAPISQEAQNRIRRLVARKALRISALAILRMGAEVLLTPIPGVGEAADVMALIDLASTVSEFKQLKIDADAAITFVKSGPYDLEELQVSAGYQEFSSYDAFYKTGLNVDVTTKMFGPAGPGSQYHHIVTQGGDNEDKISSELFNNTENIISLPTLLHEAVNGKYSETAKGMNMTRYEWIQTLPYDEQRDEGLKILRELNIIR